MGLVGCMARLLTDIIWPLKVLARLSALTSTGGKLRAATGLGRAPPYTCHTHMAVDVALDMAVEMAVGMAVEIAVDMAVDHPSVLQCQQYLLLYLPHMAAHV